ncbi:MAG: hypothetical protein HFH41_14090, partial [Lachnospiraceae bacterium]|nr:hypothetical protein [Lachnospiraceae bacterium]
MLTAKNIGGGSAKVTNGILQEMYAAEGEIPAGTFVETVPVVGSPAEPGLKVENIYDSNIEPSYNFKLQLKEDLFFYILKDTEKPALGTMNADHSITVAYSDISINGSFVTAVSPSDGILLILSARSTRSSQWFYQVCAYTDGVLTAVNAAIQFRDVQKDTVNADMTYQLDSDDSSFEVAYGPMKAIRIAENKILIAFKFRALRASGSIVYRELLTFNPSTNALTHSDLVKIIAYTHTSSSADLNMIRVTDSKVLLQSRDASYETKTLLVDVSADPIVSLYENTGFDFFNRL